MCCTGLCRSIGDRNSGDCARWPFNGVDLRHMPAEVSGRSLGRVGRGRATPGGAAEGALLEVIHRDHRVQLRVHRLDDVRRRDAPTLHRAQGALHAHLLLHRVADLDLLLHHEQLLVALVRPLHRLHEVGAARRPHAARAARGHHAGRLALEEQPRLARLLSNVHSAAALHFCGPGPQEA